MRPRRRTRAFKVLPRGLRPLKAAKTAWGPIRLAAEELVVLFAQPDGEDEKRRQGCEGRQGCCLGCFCCIPVSVKLSGCGITGELQ